VGNDVVLIDDTGDFTCYRCFRLELRPPNVLQAHTSGLGKCFTTEERAMQDCPTDADVKDRRAKEIMAWKLK